MKTILLRSGWQTENIGDITHTPGVLAVLEKHWPDAPIILWPNDITRGVEAMLRARFPRLRFVRDAGKREPHFVSETDPTLETAFAEADLLLHGPGACLVAQNDVEKWWRATGKPFGAYGITLGSDIGATDGQARIPDALRELLENAAFVFTRETRSLAVLQSLQIPNLPTGFAPDGTFAFDIRDEKSADNLLAEYGLQTGEFVCVVPRLRLTPYWEIRPEIPISPDEIARRKALNAQFAPLDHAKLREIIEIWVRQTGKSVLICPEMNYQVAIARPLVFEPLDADVKPFVQTLNRYWLPDEAASVYARSEGVVSLECHSPIIANAVGRPGFYLAQPTDTWKSQMYPDLGLGDWAWNIETADPRQVAARLLETQSNAPQTRETVKNASQSAHEQFRRTMPLIRALFSA